MVLGIESDPKSTVIFCKFYHGYYLVPSLDRAVRKLCLLSEIPFYNGFDIFEFDLLQFSTCFLLLLQMM